MKSRSEPVRKTFPHSWGVPAGAQEVDRHLHRLRQDIGEIQCWYQEDWKASELVLWRLDVSERLAELRELLEDDDD